MNLGRISTAALAVLTIVGTAACSGGGIASGPTPAVSTGPSTPATGSQSVAAIAEPPVTLRLAIADGAGRPSAAAVNHFVARVATLSGGNVTIVPTFDAGAGTEKGFEEGVAALVERGDAELGVAASRVWDLSGITSLRGLQAPYLIDNDALAVAVSTSDIARRALDGMGPEVLGLTLWPEDLRHLFSFPKCGRDFRSVADVAGSTVLIQPSAMTRTLLAGLGGIEYVGVDRESDAAACSLHGQEAGLSQLAAIADHTAIAVGNVALFPKYQVLAANKAAFDHLGEAQRRVLRNAADDTLLDAINRHPDDAALAMAWCAQGGGVVDASAAQKAKFLAAAEPIYRELEKDALTRPLIADIRALKSATSPSAGASSCSGTAARPSTAPPDTTGYVGTMVPDGVYRANITESDLIARGADAKFATSNWGVKTFTFASGRVTLDQGENGGPPCYGTATSVGGKFVRLTTDAGGGCGFYGDYVWREQGDGIALISVANPDPNDPSNPWFFNRVWTRIK